MLDSDHDHYPASNDPDHDWHRCVRCLQIELHRTQVLSEMINTRVEALEAENARLEQLVCDFQAASLLDVGNQGGPCRVEPQHVEQEITRLRAERDAAQADGAREAWAKAVALLRGLLQTSLPPDCLADYLDLASAKHLAELGAP